MAEQTQAQPSSGNPAQAGKTPVKRDSPLSASVIMMAVGGALVALPWIMGMGSLGFRIGSTVVGLALAIFGFVISK